MIMRHLMHSMLMMMRHHHTIGVWAGGEAARGDTDPPKIFTVGQKSMRDSGKT